MAVEYTIRLATEEDLPQIAQIELAMSPHPWNERQFRESLVQHRTDILEVEKTVAGFAVCSRVIDEVELLNIAVAPTRQQQGWGGCLLDHCINFHRDQAKMIFLEVRASNMPAIHLYASRGFIRVGERRGYYQTPAGRVDAIVMKLDLGR